MGKSQRIKGSVFEREVMAAFSAALGQTFKRHIGQARDGGHDGIAGKWMIECKRRKSLKTLNDWLEQASVATVKHGPLPNGTYYQSVVVARADNAEPMAIVDLQYFLDLVKRDEEYDALKFRMEGLEK